MDDEMVFNNNFYTDGFAVRDRIDMGFNINRHKAIYNALFASNC